MAIGWIATLADANNYFSTNRLETTAWDALTVVSGGKDERTAVLLMAYDRIRFHKDFSIPASPTAAQLAKLVLAQEETAYYLAMHLADEDRRKGLQAQGVVGAGIVQETYVRFNSDTMDLKDVPLPPIAYDLLEEFLSVAVPFFIADIDRDEDKGANEDVTDF